MRFLTFIFLFMGLLPASVSFADTHTQTVRANKKTAVYNMAIYNRRHCTYAQMPEVVIVRDPKHGKVTTGKSSQKLSKNTGFCAGKRVKAINVFYKPNRGYRGDDTFKVRFRWSSYDGSPTYDTSDTNFEITVK
ncbi:hypothetical protein [Coralliovum pocilloporae]|uniref:hypothetical protein n=1 Tax=Coralliovum pocilloporae TaxID=3066369 RepID=UPI003306F74D